MRGNHEPLTQQPECAFATSKKERLSSAPGLDHQVLNKPPSVAYPPSSRNSFRTDSPHSSPPRGRRPNSQSIDRDPEKASLDDHQMLSHRQPTLHASVVYTEDEDSECGDGRDEPKRHAVWILCYLSILSPVITIPIAIYTLFAAMLLLLLAPIFLLRSQPLSTRFYQLIAPSIQFQLGLIHSSHESESTHSPNAGSIFRLVLVNVLAPIYAVAIMVAAWVGGLFWFFTKILGNPDGGEERDDGRDAVLAVRRWWERWLTTGLA
ncbi:hypothetical protein ACLMJK_005315 [Lecanora helva]